MRSLVSCVLCAFLALRTASSQQVKPTFQLAPPSPYPPHLVVSAADGNTSPRSPEEIFSINQTLAREGNLNAAFQLGLAYMQGIGTAQDEKRSAHWLAVGATTPLTEAQLGRLYIEGHYLPQDPIQAAHWLTAAGRPSDLFELAEMYRKAQPSQVNSAASIYRDLLKQPTDPQARRAAIELGGFVLDGKYSAGTDAEAHAENLTWARSLAQELLGQSEYNIAVDYIAGREGIPVDQPMWARLCARAAAYNIDLAQKFYAEGILQGTVPGATPLEAYAWARLASQKQTDELRTVQRMESVMSPQAKADASALYERLVATREQDGAYYRATDPLREPSAAALAALPADDPDVEVRRAFALETGSSSEDYTKALTLYRQVRDTSWMAAMAVLGRKYMMGTEGIPTDPALAKRWLERSVEAGYRPAALSLADWYGGKGGGTADPAQALAWRKIGGCDQPGLIASSLTAESAAHAQAQYDSWMKSHPGWAASVSCSPKDDSVAHPKAR